MPEKPEIRLSTPLKEEPKYEMDEKDMAIIAELKKNSRLSEQKIAKHTGIPMTTVHNRMKKLKESGAIRQFTVRLNYEVIGRPLTAYVLIKAMPGADQKEVYDVLKKVPFAREVAVVTGEFDFIVKVRVRNVHDLNDIVAMGLRRSNLVSDSRTMIAYEVSEWLE